MNERGGDCAILTPIMYSSFPFLSPSLLFFLPSDVCYYTHLIRYFGTPPHKTCGDSMLSSYSKINVKFPLAVKYFSKKQHERTIHREFVAHIQ